MQFYNILWRLLAIALGCAATVVDGYNTLSQAIASKMTPDMVATVAVIIVVMVLALPISVRAFTKQNKLYGLICAAVFIGAWVVSYGFSFNRMGTNRMNESHNINKANLRGSIAAGKVVLAQTKLDAANRTLAKEAVTGAGPKWQEANNLRNQAKADLLEAETQLEPMKRSEAFDQTEYLVYATPFVAQAAGVVFFLIGFGAFKEEPTKKTDVIEKLQSQPFLINPDETARNKVLDYLKKRNGKSGWHTTYREIHSATGINIAFVKEHLIDLHYSGDIIMEGSSKGRGTWGKIPLLIEA